MDHKVFVIHHVVHYIKCICTPTASSVSFRLWTVGKICITEHTIRPRANKDINSLCPYIVSIGPPAAQILEVGSGYI